MSLRCPSFVSLSLFTGLATFGLVAASPAHAAPPESAPGGIEATGLDPLIANGANVGTCAWPTAVAVVGGGLCTGTLIHPELVVYAAHCGGGNKTIRFGESAFDGGRTESVAFCKVNPDYSNVNQQGIDWAFCRLQNPVTDIPVTPPVAGPCENTIIQIGQEVAVVGFGQTLDNVTGVKNWGFTSLLAVDKPGNTVALGGSGSSSVCPGDSGGPAFVQFPDGSWRTFGIASTVSGGCGGTGTHALLEGALQWIESESGLDVTPCTDYEGNWAPGPSCGGFNAQPANQGSGTWADGCAGSAASPVSDVCGPAWSDFDDSALPTVEITSPSWGDTFPLDSSLDITVDAFKHPEGYSIAEVRLEVNGAEVAEDLADPYVFKNANFGSNDAVFTLVAIAEDWAGNTVRSAPVAIGIGAGMPPDEPPPEPEETGDDGTSDSGDESDESSTSGGGPGLDEEGGCACTTQDPSDTPPWALLFAGLGLLGLRRRRSR